MRLLLHDLLLDFSSEDSRIHEGWEALFDLEIKAAAGRPDSDSPDIWLAAALMSELPRPPAARPSYSEPSSADQQRTLHYYESGTGGFLNLARPAQITFNFDDSQAQITLTRPVLDAGNLEDLTLIALAPFLRRRGFYMLHAFAAARETAVLLCGPPGSGKTTIGLALVNKGWRYLANDAALLSNAALRKEDKNGVCAYPSPGAINLHPHTLAMFPDFEERTVQLSKTTTGGKQIIARGSLLQEEEIGKKSAPVSTILFPSLTNQPEYSLHEVNPAIGLARLIEENVDQWDRDTYEAHIDLLARLSHQAGFYDLHFPRDRSPLDGLADDLPTLL